MQLQAAVKWQSLFLSDPDRACHAYRKLSTQLEILGRRRGRQREGDRERGMEGGRVGRRVPLCIPVGGELLYYINCNGKTYLNSGMPSAMGPWMVKIGMLKETAATFFIPCFQTENTMRSTVSISCFHEFSSKMDCALYLWARVNPFPLTCFCRASYHISRNKQTTMRTNKQQKLLMYQVHIFSLF